MMRFLLHYLRLLREETISWRQALLFIFLTALLFFLIGGYYPRSDYRRLQEKVEKIETEKRIFADEIARRNGLFNNLQARNNLNEKTIELLSRRIDDLLSANIYEQEKTALYRQILGGATAVGDLVIYALEANPEFDKRFWRISATLVRSGKKKNFTGAYYFEIVTATADDTTEIMRLPAKGHVEIKMGFYHEIEQQVELSATTTISNVRLVVLNSKGEEINSAELIKENGNGQEST